MLLRMPVSLTVKTTPRFGNERSEFEDKLADFYSIRKRVLGVGDSVFVGVLDSIKIDDTLLFYLTAFTL